MSNLNKVMLIGRLGKAPELKTINGNAVANMSVATSEKWTSKDGKSQERVEWHRITVWGKIAENCGKYLEKGSQVYVEGKLQTRSWEKDGQKHYATDIAAHTVGFLGSKSSGGAPAGYGDETQGTDAPSFDAGEEIPF